MKTNINKDFQICISVPSILLPFLSTVTPPGHRTYVPYPIAIYLLKVKNRFTRTRCEICSKLTINTPE